VNPSANGCRRSHGRIALSSAPTLKLLNLLGIGMPLIRKIENGLWEVRSNLDKRIARVFFTVIDEHMILLHGFIKKDLKTPKDELKLARQRNNSLRKA